MVSYKVYFLALYFKGFIIAAYIKDFWTCCCSEHPAQLLLTPRGIQHTVKPAKDTWELEERRSCWEGNKCELSFSPCLTSAHHLCLSHLFYLPIIPNLSPFSDFSIIPERFKTFPCHKSLHGFLKTTSKSHSSVNTREWWRQFRLNIRKRVWCCS